MVQYFKSRQVQVVLSILQECMVCAKGWKTITEKWSLEKKILSKLMEIAERENILIIYAAEAGSRVWGYNTPQSDYDVKFIFAHRECEYLKLTEPKDVIVEKFDGMEFEGWDIKKALKLLYASNASVFEWTKSTKVYINNPLSQHLSSVIRECYDRRKVAFHYIKLAKKKIAEMGEKAEVSPKDYLFAVRASLSAKWAIERTDFPALDISTLTKEMVSDYMVQKEIEDIKTDRLQGKHHGRSSLLDMYLGVMIFNTEGELACNPERFKKERIDIEKLNKAFRLTVKKVL